MPRPQSIYQKWTAIVVKDRPAIITHIGGDGSTNDRDTVHYAYVNADGSISPSNMHYPSVEAMERQQVPVIDFVDVDTVVTLPPEWRERARVYDLHRQEREETRAAELGEWKSERHPSYGFASLHRTSGSTRLFGSGFEHQHFMTLRIGRATRERSFGNERHHAKEELVEVHLSEVQWAALVSASGLGSGVPCTINHVYGHRMPEPPPQEDVQRFNEDIARAAKQAAVFLDEALAALTKLAEDKAPSKAARAEVLGKVHAARRKLDETAPFIVEQMQEHMEKVVTHGKAELEAYARSVLLDSGIKALADSLGHAGNPLVLETGDGTKGT